MRYRRLRAALPTLLLACCCVAEAAAVDRFDDIRAYIRAGLVEQDVPSAAVAVAKDGVILWEEGFGWADREKRVAATEHTMYSLASVTKPIMTTGLMTLVQAGKIDFDAPVNSYLGKAKLQARVGEVNEATVRRVANHTSGLPMHYQLFYSDEPFVLPSMDETILRYGNLVTAPGERFRYSNIGYGVLSYVIERVSGMSFAEFMRHEVFVPLGMTHTSFGIGPGLESFAATGYGLQDSLPIPFYRQDTPGSAGIYSSAHDLARFAMFHLKAHRQDQKDILSDALIDEMHRPSVAEDDGSSHYGIGFHVREKRSGYSIVEHGGGQAGIATLMRLFPDQKLAVIVLSNARPKTRDLMGDISDRIAAKLLPNWRILEKKIAPPGEPPSPQLDGLRGSWKGTLSTYVEEVPMEISFLPGGDVHAKVGDQLATLVNRPQFKDGVFSGDLAARIGTPDTERFDYIVRLSLTLRGDVLNGSATAIFRTKSLASTLGRIDGPRVRSALSHWVDLSRSN